MCGVLLLLPPPRYGFATPSTLKPTQWSYPLGSINQIPGQATICGDVRVTPFYDMAEVGAGGGVVCRRREGTREGVVQKGLQVAAVRLHRIHAVCTHILLHPHDALSAELIHQHTAGLMTLPLAGDRLQLITTAAAGHVQDPGVCG